MKKIIRLCIYDILKCVYECVIRNLALNLFNLFDRALHFNRKKTILKILVKN